MLALKVRWLACIEILYLWLCSFFSLDHLKTMKWYVGESMIFDEYHKLRDKDFFMQWGMDSLYLFIDFLSYKSSKDVQYHRPYIKDT